MADAALRGRLRLLRAAAFGTACVVLAAVAHSAGGGGVPHPAVLAFLSLLVGWVAVAITSRHLRLPSTVLVVLVCQAVLHEAFMAMGGMGACGPTVGGHGTGGHHLAALSCQGASMVDPSHGLMPVAHLVAAAVMAGFLARADQLVASLLRLCAAVRSRLRQGAPAPVELVRSMRVVANALPVPAPSPAQRHVKRRGPPASGHSRSSFPRQGAWLTARLVLTA